MAGSASMLMLSSPADPDTPTLIPDNSYDALLCCAGFFQVTTAHFVTGRRSENDSNTWNSQSNMEWENYRRYLFAQVC